MHAIDAAPNLESMPPSLMNDGTSRTDAALAVAKGHFIARGWRPMAIQPPALQKLCEDVSMLLLMNDAGDTAWLSARDWSALGNPVDAFRREMVCVRAARVNETILVYDGDFPENVVEVAAHEPSLKLIDAAALRSMSTAAAPAAAVVAAAMAPTRRQRLAHPARQAARYLAQVRDARPVAAAERYFHDRFAHRVRQLNGERRRLKTLSTALLMLVGASLGFLAFNMVVVLQAPESSDAETRTLQADPQPLPQPMPPPQGYVAQAAGMSGGPTRSAHAAYRLERAPKPILVAAVPASGSPVIADAGLVRGKEHGYEDVELTQRRADAAMRVIAGSTREVRAASPAAVATGVPIIAPTSAPTPDMPSVHPMDPAMADSELSPPDPAIID